MSRTRTKRKLTDQELKDKLWEMAVSVDWEEDDIYGLESHDEFDEWQDAMANREGKMLQVNLPVTDIELNKVIRLLEDNGTGNRLVKTLKHIAKTATQEEGPV